MTAARKSFAVANRQADDKDPARSSGAGPGRRPGRGRTIGWLLLAAGLATGWAAASGAGLEKEPGTLYQAFFSGDLYSFTTRGLDLGALGVPEDKASQAAAKARLNAWVAADRAFRPTLPLPGGKAEPERRWIAQKRRCVERGMATLLGPKAAAGAATYATRAVIYYEWEGMSDGPLAEAAYAEKWLEKQPNSPLRPYLVLFLLHRWRCALEALSREKALDEIPKLKAKYAERLGEAKRHPDLLVRLIAADLDQAKWVYLKPEK